MQVFSLPAQAPSVKPPTQQEEFPMSELTPEPPVSRRERLHQLESIIQNNLYGLNIAWDSLSEINADELYKEIDFSSFASYLERKWPTVHKRFSSRHYQMLRHEEIVTDIKSSLDGGTAASIPPVERTEPMTLDLMLPDSERQTRPLNAIPAELRGPIWEAAVEANGGKRPTGAMVETVVADYLNEITPDRVGEEPESLSACPEYKPPPQRERVVGTWHKYIPD